MGDLHAPSVFHPNPPTLTTSEIEQTMQTGRLVVAQSMQPTEEHLKTVYKKVPNLAAYQTASAIRETVTSLPSITKTALEQELQGLQLAYEMGQKGVRTLQDKATPLAKEAYKMGKRNAIPLAKEGYEMGKTSARILKDAATSVLESGQRSTRLLQDAATPHVKKALDKAKELKTAALVAAQLQILELQATVPPIAQLALDKATEYKNAAVDAAMRNVLKLQKAVTPNESAVAAAKLKVIELQNAAISVADRIIDTLPAEAEEEVDD